MYVFAKELEHGHFNFCQEECSLLLLKAIIIAFWNSNVEKHLQAVMTKLLFQVITYYGAVT